MKLCVANGYWNIAGVEFKHGQARASTYDRLGFGVGAGGGTPSETSNVIGDASQCTGRCGRQRARKCAGGDSRASAERMMKCQIGANLSASVASFCWLEIGAKSINHLPISPKRTSSVCERPACAAFIPSASVGAERAARVTFASFLPLHFAAFPGRRERPRLRL